MFEAQLGVPFQAVLNKLKLRNSWSKTRPTTIGPEVEIQRFGTLASLGGLALALHAFASSVLGDVTRIAALSVAVCLICDVALVLGRAITKVPREKFVRVARGLVLLHAAALSSYSLTLADSRVNELSFVTIQAVAVMVAVPTKWGVAATIAGVTCLLQPVAAHVAVLLNVVPGDPGDLARAWLGAALTFALCLGLYATIHEGSNGTERTAGGYVLKRKLGEGGMGEVWEAQHSALACPAAVKFIALKQDEASTARFQREARATAMLTSIHTVRLYDYGVTNDGRPYYAMELLNGFDLQRVVDDSGPLPPARVVALMKQVCDSLTEAHAAGLIHRDLKPQNLFITHLGQQFDVVKVLDFGLVAIQPSVRWAAELSSITGTGHITGTPEYYPPELASGKAADARSDIYQLGCAMFFLLTGETVFSAASPLAAIYMHTSEPPRRASALRGKSVPQDLDDLVVRCLEKDPAKRPRSARALLRELSALGIADAWTQEDARMWWTETAVFPEPNRETAARRLRS